MLSALKSNFYVMKSFLRILIICQIALIIFGHSINSAYCYLFYPTFAGIFMPINVSTQESTSSFTPFLLSSPISRKNVVLSKYLSVFSYCIPALFISSIFMVILGDANAYDAIRSFIIDCSIIILGVSIVTPLTFIFKPQHVTVIFIAICFAPAIITTIAVKKLDDITIDKIELLFTNFYNNISNLILVLVISVIILAISNIISIIAFNKKEF